MLNLGPMPSSLEVLGLNHNLLNLKVLGLFLPMVLGNMFNLKVLGHNLMVLSNLY